MKEISLTQDIMDLIINYQIPLDLLSVDKDELPSALQVHSITSSISEVDIVRTHVNEMKVSYSIRRIV